MHQLTDLIRSDMKPALGVTEPGAIAYAAAKARSCLTEPVQSIHVTMNSGSVSTNLKTNAGRVRPVSAIDSLSL